VRYRGVPYVVRPWGDRPITGETVEGEFLPMPPRVGRPDLLHTRLRALAFGVDGLDAAAAPARLTLLDGEGGALRTATVEPRVPHATSWAFFAFEPIEASRFLSLEFRLELPPQTRLVGTADGPSIVAFHGDGDVDPRLVGMSARGAVLGDRDLVFRAWSAPGSRLLLARLADRGGESLIVGAVLWIVAAAGVGALLRRTNWSQSL
jgi:hypothetical protein